MDEQRKVQSELSALKTQESDMKAARRRLEHAKRAALVAPQIEALSAAQAKLKRVQDELVRGESSLKSKKTELEAARAVLGQS